MKKNNKLIASIVIISALATSIHLNSFAESGKIKGNSVRLRAKASTSSEAIEVYNNGEQVEVIEKSGEWYKVKVDGQTGYIYEDFLTVSGDVTEEKQEEEKKEEPKQEETKKEEENDEEKVTEEPEKKEETKQDIEVKLGKTKSIADQKVYILPNLGSSVVGNIKKDAEVDIIQDASGWVYVSTEDTYGWTRYDKIVEIENTTTESNEDDKKDEKKEEPKEEPKKDEEDNKKDNQNENKTGYISGSGVNMRAKAGKSAEVIDVLKLNTEVTILAEDDDWCKVKVGNQTGYVSKQFISDKKTETTSRSNSEERKVDNTTTETATKKQETTTTKSDGGVTGQDIVDYAMQFKGYPYVYAAADPSVGFDCSGLAWYVYKHFGYSIERSSRGLATDGKTISNKEDLQPGDVLVFLAYNDYSRVGHVGIYIGNNQFIHANDESTGVIITSLDHGKYPERFVSGRRFID